MDSATSRESGRIRVSEIADELGIDFPELLAEFWRQCPKVVDDKMTVPAGWLRVLRYARFGREAA